MKKMKLSDIRINETFANSVPSESKMEECRKNWDKWHRQDRYIVVNHNNILIDGYIQYLILKENNIEEAEIKISNLRKKRWHRKNTKDWDIPHYRNESTTYVYGTHPNSNCTKEFMWRVPKSWTWFAENIQVDDSILCRTKFGIAPVVVTKVEILNECPVDFCVKRVASKEIRRGSYTVIP